MLKTDLFLCGNLEIQSFQMIKKSMNVQNVATYFQIWKYFNFTEFAKLALCYIERCFTIVCETNNFLELDFTLIAKIFASSELRIDSELEVMNAAKAWLRYNYETRSEFWKYLLLKIRLTLLPPLVLNDFLRRNSHFDIIDKIDGCLETLTKVLQNKKGVYQNKTNSFFSTRFCTHNTFNLIVSGRYKFIRNGQTIHEGNSFQHINGKSFEIVKRLTLLKLDLKNHKVIYL